MTTTCEMQLGKIVTVYGFTQESRRPSSIALTLYVLQVTLASLAALEFSCLWAS